MDNYKGAFYKNSKEQRYFEGGAHFRYKDLYEMLSFLGGVLPKKENDNNNIPSGNIVKYIYNSDINKNLLKPKTRNKNQFNYINNPNTQITFSKNKIQKYINNKSTKNTGNIKSRNIPNNNFFDEINKNYNKTNTNILNYNQKNCMRFNLIQNFINKNRNYQNNEEKDSINAQPINFNNVKNINNQLFDRKAFIGKKSLHQLNYNNKNNDMKSKEIINCYNFYNENKLVNIRKNNHSLASIKKMNNLKEKLNIYFPKKDIDFKYSRNIINKNLVEFGKTFDFNKNINHKVKNNNNQIEPINKNKIEHNMKNCHSGLINNNMNKIINKKLLHDLCEKNNNIMNNEKEKDFNIINNNLISQKYVRKKIGQLFAYKNSDINKNKNQKMSRNINNMNNIFNTQSIKFKTTSELKINNNF